MPYTWSWLEVCLDGDAKLIVQLLLVRVVRTVGYPFGDLSSVASTLAFSTAPAGVCIYWMLLCTVPSWDEPFHRFNDYTETEKGVIRLAKVAFEAAGEARQHQEETDTSNCTKAAREMYKKDVQSKG